MIPRTEGEGPDAWLRRVDDCAIAIQGCGCHLSNLSEVRKATKRLRRLLIPDGTICEHLWRLPEVLADGGHVDSLGPRIARAVLFDDEARLKQPAILSRNQVANLLEAWAARYGVSAGSTGWLPAMACFATAALFPELPLSPEASETWLSIAKNPIARLEPAKLLRVAPARHHASLKFYDWSLDKVPPDQPGALEFMPEGYAARTGLWDLVQRRLSHSNGITLAVSILRHDAPHPEMRSRLLTGLHARLGGNESLDVRARLLAASRPKDRYVERLVNAATEYLRRPRSRSPVTASILGLLLEASRRLGAPGADLREAVLTAIRSSPSVALSIEPLLGVVAAKDRALLRRATADAANNAAENAPSSPQADWPEAMAAVRLVRDRRGHRDALVLARRLIGDLSVNCVASSLARDRIANICEALSQWSNEIEEWVVERARQAESLAFIVAAIERKPAAAELDGVYARLVARLAPGDGEAVIGAVLYLLRKRGTLGAESSMRAREVAATVAMTSASLEFLVEVLQVPYLGKARYEIQVRAVALADTGTPKAQARRLLRMLPDRGGLRSEARAKFRGRPLV